MKKKLALLMTAIVSTSALALAGCKTNIGWIDEKICKHEYEFVEITLEPTCTEEGERLMECVDCGKQKTEVMEKIAHEEVVTPGKDPTCTEGGYTEKIVCNVCQEVLQAPQARPALGHTEKVAAEGKDPTCTETGLTAGVVCVTCGEVITEQTVIPATGHKDSDGDFLCDVCDITLLNEVVPVKGECVAGKTYRIYPAQKFDGGDVYSLQPELCVTVTLLDGTTRDLYVTVCGEKFHEINQSGFVFEDSFGDGYRDVTFKVGTYTALDMNDNELTFVINETSVINDVKTNDNPGVSSVGYVRRLEATLVASEES